MFSIFPFILQKGSDNCSCCCLVAKSCPTCHAPLSVGFPKQQYWSSLPFPSPGDLPYLRTGLLHLLQWQATSSLLSHKGSPTSFLYRGLSVFPISYEPTGEYVLKGWNWIPKFNFGMYSFLTELSNLVCC